MVAIVMYYFIRCKKNYSSFYNLIRLIVIVLNSLLEMSKHVEKFLTMAEGDPKNPKKLLRQQVDKRQV